MNTQARDNMHKTKEALKSAKDNLQTAANEVENGNVRKHILNEVDHVTDCLQECEKIAAGLSQYLTEKKFEGIHH